LSKKVTIKQALEDVRNNPTIDLWPHTGMLLGLGRNSTYAATLPRDGQPPVIQTIRVGKAKRALSAPLRKLLQIEMQEAS